MGYQSSRAWLVSLTATGAAFGAAAMISAATAPSAHADDFSDIVAAVENDIISGQGDFGTALSDFGSNQVPTGVAVFLDGVDEDLWAVPTNLFVGSVEALTGESVIGPIGVANSEFPNFADALANAEQSFSGGITEFSDAATAFASGDYGDAAYDDAFGALNVFYFPIDDLLIGASVGL
jgi:hypothetical protein